MASNLGRLDVADLSPEQLKTLREAEDKLNAAAGGQEIYLMALKK